MRQRDYLADTDPYAESDQAATLCWGEPGMTTEQLEAAERQAAAYFAGLYEDRLMCGQWFEDDAAAAEMEEAAF